MSNEPQSTAAAPALRQYRTLLEVAEAIATHRELPALLRDLTARLQLVVQFDGVNVVLYDGAHKVMRMHVLETPALSGAEFPTELPVAEAPAGWVWQTQQALLLTDLDAHESRYPRAIADLKRHGIKTIYVLPLTSAGRRLGALGFGSFQAEAWSAADQEFLQQVAKLVAVAVDNALNFEQARAAEAAAQRRLEELQLLLEINNAVVSALDLRELLEVISPCLRRVVRHDFAALLVYDPACDQLRAHALDLPERATTEGVLFSMDGTPSGNAFRSRQPVLVTRQMIEQFSTTPLVKILRAEGVQSGCSLPLLSHDRALGVLTLMSLRENNFSAQDVALLTQVAGQIAIAVENALNFERARNVEQELARKLNHLRLMLQVTTAVVAQLELQELLQVVSTSIREALGAATVGVGLYDPERDELRAYATDFPSGPGFKIPFEGSPGGLAFTSGQPVFLDKPDLVRFSSDFAKQVVEAGFRSGGSIPLIAQGRKLGVLGVASKREAAFSAEDQELLVQVANQVAIAIDNALNFERARKAEQEAKQQSERLGLVLRINNAVVSQLELRELPRAISGSLRELVPNDTTGVALYDAASHKLRVVMTDFPAQMELIEESDWVPLEGSAMGLAFTSGEPVFLDEFDLERFPSDFTRRSYEAGLRSCGNLPLIAHGRKLGAIGVASKRPCAFSATDIELIRQCANQIALAVDNALNYERTRAAEAEAKRQSERLQLMLEINNAVVSQLSLRELVRVTAARLRAALPHDVTGISLYDPETNQFRAYMFDMPAGLPAIEEGTPMPLEGTVGGQAFLSGRPVFLDRYEPERLTSEFDRRLLEAGIKSGGVIPLIAHDRKLGFLGVGSFREAAFSEADQELLCHIANQIAIAVENALAFREIETLKNKLASEKLYLEDEIRTQHNFEELIGDSPTFRRILKQVETVAPTDSTVLIRGETGTGKELIARAIHALSTRRERTLVKLNCAAIPTGLLESELFGHEKGAFTGAITQRIGRFGLAHQGTLLLDEVGDIPLELQPKLLRVLQEQEFERLGSTRTQRVDVRLIAATNCDLEQLVAERKYRSDLYYRLNVFPITIPPLRQRREDIPALTRFFTQKYARRLKKPITAIPAEALAALTAYHWPGNVRELEHFIERAVILTRGTDLEISPAELKATEPVPTAAPLSTPPLATLEDAERDHILRALEETNWVVGGPQGAAARLGMKRTTLQSRMQKLGITRAN